MTRSPKGIASTELAAAEWRRMEECRSPAWLSVDPRDPLPVGGSTFTDLLKAGVG